MLPDRHIAEDAELYALGMLEEEQRAAVDAHVAACDACLRRLGEAEETVLALERRNVAMAIPFGSRFRLPSGDRGISAWWLPAVAAAALIVGLLLPHKPFNHDPALLAMINSHFNHAQFSGANGPPAKVLYARDRSWYYVIVTGDHRYGVYGITAGGASPLGVTTPNDGTSQLFVRSAGRFDRLELRDAGKAIESAAIR